MELFTNHGQGTVITPEKIEKFRSANIQDAKVIEKMINPLIKTQIIAERSLEKIEMEIQHFHILEFDNKILGCAQVKHYDGISEIALTSLRYSGVIPSDSYKVISCSTVGVPFSLIFSAFFFM